MEYMKSDKMGALSLVGDMGDPWGLFIQTFVYLGVLKKGQDWDHRQHHLIVTMSLFFHFFHLGIKKYLTCVSNVIGAHS